jgi:GNAT superfamily N-acetyltransferase
MLSVEKIDTLSGQQVKRYIDLPFRLYAPPNPHHAQWVPPIRIDIQAQLNRKKHPFYEHSDADFFIAVRDGQVVGRIAAIENRRYNDFHGVRQAQFYHFECEDDLEAAQALFERVYEWARQRGLDTIVGPKGFGPLDGYGMLVEGYEHRQMMTMMNYNLPYLVKLVEALGFRKEVDFVSCYVSAEEFRLPERIHSIADRVVERGTLAVKRFTKKSELLSWTKRIGEAYNKAFVNNWEYYPFTEREIDFVVNSIITVADPRLIKAITHGDEVVGFLFAFPDVSAAIQRSNGRLLPFGIVDMMLEMRRTRWVAINGAGILPEFQGRGGNALLYSEMEKTIRGYNYEHADLVQVAETAVTMRQDLMNLGGKPFKNHRVFRKEI